MSTRVFFKAIANVLFAISVAMCVGITGCASSSGSSYHTFSFDGRFDKWAKSVDLLEYDYGGKVSLASRKVGADASSLGPGTGINATMPNGEYLYVKWRLLRTGEVIEKRVDLRGLLPVNMFEHTVTFVIDERELYVYLVTPQNKLPTAPPILKTYLSVYREAFEIYPSNTFNK